MKVYSLQFTVYRVLFLFTVHCLLLTASAFATVELSEESIFFYNEGRYKEAISSYKKILEKEPNQTSLLNLAIIYKDLSLYDEAIELLKKIAPKDKKIRNLLAKIYYLNSQSEEAIPYLEESLRLNSEDKDAILYLGLCYEDLGNILEAKKNYLKVIEIDEPQPFYNEETLKSEKGQGKNNIIALFKLAKIYEKENNFKGAIDLYERIRVLDPSIIEVNRILADLYLRMEDLLNSYRAHTKAVAIEPKDSRLKERLDLVKSKLPEEFFEEEKRKQNLLRKEISISVKPMEVILGCPKIKVGIFKSDSFEFKCGGNFEIKDKKGDTIFKGKENTIYRLILDKEKKKVSLKNEEGSLKILDLPFLIKSSSDSQTICIFDLPFGEDQFWARRENLCFREDLEVEILEDKLSLINILSLEEYLYGVLPSEIPFDSPFQALKAQAIVARTQALKKLGRHKKEGFDFCSEVHCQVYAGAKVEKEITNKAVDETKGLVITYEDKPIDALYSANCGGHTQENIFGGDAVYLEPLLDIDKDIGISFPLSPLDLENYLLGLPDTYCSSEKASFRWVRIYEKKDLERILNCGKLSKILPLARSVSGHLKSIKILGENTKLIEGELKIRKTLGNLRSSLFKIETKLNKEKIPEFFIFYGAGFGHGVGMCQEGAIGMAKKEKNYLEIISHYFPKTEIKKFYGR